MDCILILPQPLPIAESMLRTRFSEEQIQFLPVREEDLDTCIETLLERPVPAQETGFAMVLNPGQAVQDLCPEGCAWFPARQRKRTFALVDQFRTLFPGGSFLMAEETQTNRTRTLRSLIEEWKDERDTLLLWRQVERLCARAEEVPMQQGSPEQQARFASAIRAARNLLEGEPPVRKPDLEKALAQIRSAAAPFFAGTLSGQDQAPRQEAPTL